MISNLNAATLANKAPAAVMRTTGSAQALNQNDFLQLLVKQIQFQDPLNPKSNTDMAAQMAQFTALQQSSQMSSSLTMLQANSLVGSTVMVQPRADDTATITGVVSGMSMATGTPQIVLTQPDGTTATYNLNQLVAVIPTSPTTGGGK